MKHVRNISVEMVVHTCLVSNKSQCMIVGVQKHEPAQRHLHEKAFVTA